jgi:cob(I)alamin adenosyltransferase
MDKKAKKRIDLLQQKLQKLRLQLSGAKKQPDEPADIVRLEREITEAEAEVHRLKES